MTMITSGKALLHSPMARAMCQECRGQRPMYRLDSEGLWFGRAEATIPIALTRDLNRHMNFFLAGEQSEKIFMLRQAVLEHCIRTGSTLAELRSNIYYALKKEEVEPDQNGTFKQEDVLAFLHERFGGYQHLDELLRSYGQDFMQPLKGIINHYLSHLWYIENTIPVSLVNEEERLDLFHNTVSGYFIDPKTAEVKIKSRQRYIAFKIYDNADDSFSQIVTNTKVSFDFTFKPGKGFRLDQVRFEGECAAIMHDLVIGCDKRCLAELSAPPWQRKAYNFMRSDWSANSRWIRWTGIGAIVWGCAKLVNYARLKWSAAQACNAHIPTFAELTRPKGAGHGEIAKAIQHQEDVQPAPAIVGTHGEEKDVTRRPTTPSQWSTDGEEEEEKGAVAHPCYDDPARDDSPSPLQIAGRFAISGDKAFRVKADGDGGDESHQVTLGSSVVLNGGRKE